MSLYGSLFKNDVGGTLISDENPTYMEVSVTPYSHTSAGSNSQLWNVSDNRSWGNDWDFGTLWNQTRTKSLLFNTPYVFEVYGAPLVAVPFASIPSGCDASWAWSSYGSWSPSANNWPGYYPFITGAENAPFTYDGMPFVSVRRYYETAGLCITSIERVRDYRDGYGRTEWRLNYVSNTQINTIRTYIPMDTHYVDIAQSHGLEVKDQHGTVKFSTRVKAPLTGRVLRPKQFATGQLGSPLESNDIRWAKPRYAPFASGIAASDWVIVSTNSYGVAASTHGISDMRLEENAYGGDLYKRVNYAGALGYYRVGVVRCGAGLKLAPLFHTLSSWGGVSTSSSSFGSLVVGMPDINHNIGSGVSAPNYTMDEASNTAIIISG